MAPILARRPTARRPLLIVLVLGLAVQVPSAGAYVYPVYDDKAFQQREKEQNPNYYSQMLRLAHELYLMRKQLERLKGLPSRYRASYLASWRHAAARDAYGLAAGWSRAMNGEEMGSNTIATAQERISYDSGIQGLSSAERRGFGNGQPEVQNVAVSADLMDNSVREAMRVLGTYRRETEQLDRQIVELQRDLTAEGSQDRDQLLQKATISRVLAAAQARYTNRLLASRVEQQALAAQSLRDQKARALAAAVYGLKARPSLWLFAKTPDIRTSVRF